MLNKLQAMQQGALRHLTRQRSAAVVIAVVFGVMGTLTHTLSHAQTPTANVEPESGSVSSAAAVTSDSSASGSSAVKFGSGCTTSSILVNPCRPLFGETAFNYPEVANNSKSQILYAEQRIGHQLDLVHSYHAPGSNALDSDEIYFAGRSNSTIFVNWKPASTWTAAANSSNNAGIDSMAASVKALGSKKIFMTLWHEPENDVSPGGDANCPNVAYKGTAGTAADYRAMWAYVENRFATDGVTNVIWAMDYMNYSPWDCLVPDLWPGNSLVDWVVFNGYAHDGNSTFQGIVGRYYNLLTADNTTTDDFLSKPWGIVEWGVGDDSATPAQQATYYDSATATLTANTYPKLKLYMLFDERGGGSTSGIDYRSGYSAGVVDQNEQNHYNTFVNTLLGL